ncbi:hypothetical protein PMAYCL1PPCAC_05288 [Pristionchus mayeri]|uniref:Peptidase M13 C-terminal domain-containing protein n=1 Tax=Pristionchus mayeri TaxID=1317129 RepID=A0AAN4Z6B6_9BILA|nr:hypothetical protein PMAYCL1PPCAC_05288 [Pristionchus mayeri]
MDVSFFCYFRFKTSFAAPANPDEWPSDTNTFNINVHYNYESNSILFPILWTMDQFLDSTLANLFSFAGFGSIIGHEMTHAFDFKGRHFGPTGVDRNLTIGTTSANFKEKQKCFHRQYSGLGELRDTAGVLAENTADNVALVLAYKAWKKQNELGSKRLPGLELNADQAFFTAFAQNWCTLSTGATGTHSLGKLRVLGPLQNSPEFAKAFSCPAGSKMNPTNKCTLW